MNTLDKNQSLGIKIKTRLKHCIFFLIGFLILISIIEFSSYLLLRTVLKTDLSIDYFDADRLVKNFPAQFRMNSSEIREIFPRALPTMQTGNYLSFPFDPVMGFKADNALEWYGGNEQDAKSKYLIVTFGGSTTVKDNWPKYLIKYAEKENVKQDIIVLNAGHWGYMSFNEKIYLTSWILPMLNKYNIKPDLILSLDGDNDIWSRIMGYLEYKKQGMPFWYHNYHGYHQQLYTDMNNIGDLSGSTSQFLSSLARKAYKEVTWYMSPFTPYTFQATLRVLRTILQKAPVKDNGIEIKTRCNLDDNTESLIVKGYKTGLIDFLGAAKVRDIPFVGYLQPILHEKYHPFKTPDSILYPNINYFLINYYRENKHWSRIDENVYVDIESLYQKAENMYSELNNKYNGNFKSLTYLFNDIPDTDQLYNKDAIHYAKKGKELIAHAVIKDLISKGILAN